MKKKHLNLFLLLGMKMASNLLLGINIKKENEHWGEENTKTENFKIDPLSFEQSAEYQILEESVYPDLPGEASDSAEIPQNIDSIVAEITKQVTDQINASIEKYVLESKVDNELMSQDTRSSDKSEENIFDKNKQLVEFSKPKGKGTKRKIEEVMIANKVPKPIKPNMSYSELIAEALQNSSSGMLLLCDIYKSISARYPYYDMNYEYVGWRNSIKLNLITNKMFIKSNLNINGPSTSKKGEGSFWKLSQNQEEYASYLQDDDSTECVMEKSIYQTEIVTPKTKSQTEESVLNFSKSNNQVEDTGSLVEFSKPKGTKRKIEEVKVAKKVPKPIKPNMSYSELIAEALQNSTNGMLNLTDIYKSISTRHPYYNMNYEYVDWQNSIRGELTLNELFIKSNLNLNGPSTSKKSKGSFWELSQNQIFHRDDSIECVLEKSINQIEIVSQKNKSQTEASVPNFSRSNDQIEDVVIKVKATTTSPEIKCQVSESKNETKDAASNFSIEGVMVAKKVPKPIKPKMFYSELIAEALQNSSSGMLILPDIYKSISTRHPYYNMDCNFVRWQNSIRHTLSLNEMFTKSTDGPSTSKKGKGGFWKLSQNQSIGLERYYPDCGFDKNKDNNKTNKDITEDVEECVMFQDSGSSDNSEEFENQISDKNEKHSTEDSKPTETTNIDSIVKCDDKKIRGIKPKMSFSELIAETLENSTNSMSTLSDMFLFISAKYPYYKMGNHGWKDSIKRRLAIDKRYTKVGENKGSYWTLSKKDECLKKNGQKDTENQSKVTVVDNDTDNLKVIYFRCSDCGETFPENQFLIEHMEYVHKKIRNYFDVKCPLCDFSSNERKSVNRHVIDCHMNSNQMFQCENCELKYRSAGGLQRHYSKCLTKDEYLKKNDIKDSENQSKITAVENNADNLKVIDFRCTICPAFFKTFQSENSLEDHIKTYHRLDNLINIEPMSENFDIREMEKSINQTEIVSPKTKSQTEESLLNFSRSNDQIEDVVIKVEPTTSFEIKCQVSESRNETKDAAINVSRPKNQSEGGVVINFSGLEPKKSVQIKCQVTSGKKVPSLIKCQVPPGKKAPSLIKCQVPPSKKIKEEPR